MHCLSLKCAFSALQVASVMNSYSDIDGVPAASNPDLLTGTLRDRWGFTGTVVSDYSAVSFLESMHRVAATLEEAGLLSLSAGVDIELPISAAASACSTATAADFKSE